MKSLETALRFGAPLIVMDVDKVDPILNNVLNRETHKSPSAASPGFLPCQGVKAGSGFSGVVLSLRRPTGSDQSWRSRH